MGHLTKFRAINSFKTFGVELECYPKSCPHGHEEERYLPFFYKTTDASLGWGGYEYISEPMPYDMMVAKLKKLHIWLGGWNVQSDCGLHIHVSRQYWPEKAAKEFVGFLNAHASRSSLHKLWFGRSSRFAEFNDWDVSQFEKFSAINCRHPKTFEFRMWNAGDLEWTLEALRRTRAIVEYRGRWSIDVLNSICRVPKGTVPVPLVPATPEIRRRAESLGELLRQSIRR